MPWTASCRWRILSPHSLLKSRRTAHADPHLVVTASRSKQSLTSALTISDQHAPIHSYYYRHKRLALPGRGAWGACLVALGCRLDSSLQVHARPSVSLSESCCVTMLHKSRFSPVCGNTLRSLALGIAAAQGYA